MNYKPLVSVVIPTYNSEKFIKEALTSVLNQTYSNLEIIIVDDASTDQTRDIVTEFQQEDNRIVFEKLKMNSGAAVARNTAIKRAKGSYISFLDSDDKWLSNKIEVQLSYLLEKNCAIVYSSYYCMNELGYLLNKKVIALPQLDFKKILKCNYIGNLTGMYSVEKLGKIYAPNIRKRQDWALWIKAIETAGIAYGIETPLAVYRERENSISSNKYDLVKYNFRIYNHFLKYSYVKSLKLMASFLHEYFFVKKNQIQE